MGKYQKRKRLKVAESWIWGWRDQRMKIRSVMTFSALRSRTVRKKIFAFRRSKNAKFS